MTTGNIIRRLREARGHSQSRLALLAGCSQFHVSQLERQEVRLTPRLRKGIAAALGIAEKVLSDESK